MGHDVQPKFLAGFHKGTKALVTEIKALKWGMELDATCPLVLRHVPQMRNMVLDGHDGRVDGEQRNEPSVSARDIAQPLVERDQVIPRRDSRPRNVEEVRN